MKIRARRFTRAGTGWKRPRHFSASPGPPTLSWGLGAGQLRAQLNSCLEN